MDPAERYARLKQLFLGALTDAGELRGRPAGPLEPEDQELAADLAAMLRAHDASYELSFRELASAAAARLGGESLSMVGCRFGAWRVVRLLAGGGMGQVYLAERADASYRELAALKISNALLPTASALERFRRERQTLADLKHPGIATLLDGGETEEGVPYLVLEYVDGESIDTYCDRERLDVAARIRLFLGVCDAVAHAHRRLVVHRDIKPSNVLVDRAGHPKLLDFGIAKLLDEEPAAGLTRTHERPLTPEFAAPEQLRGEAITTATDVYALGGLLYRLLVGGPPHGHSSDTAAAIERVICETNPTRPSAARALLEGGASQRVRELEGDLDNIILTAMRREPERRYASVDAFAEDLQRYLEDRPVQARPDTIRYRARKFVRRHRVSVAAAAVAVMALVGGAAVAFWQARVASVQRDVARSAAARAERVNAFLATVLSSPDPVRGAGRSTTVAELLDRASAHLAEELAGEPATEATLRATLGETYLNLGLSVEAERELRRALELGAPAHVLLATALRQLGDLPGAERELRLALADADGKPVTIDSVRAFDGLTAVLRQAGRHDEALVAGGRAVELARSRFPDDRTALASALNNLALVHGERGEFALAEPLHREALEIMRAARGERHPQTAEALANLAGVLDAQGRFAEAEPLYRSALEVQLELLGENHPDYVRTLTSFANVLWLGQRFTEAEAPARHACELATRAFGPDHPLTAYAENILGGVLLDLGQAREAEAYIRAALESRRTNLPAGHWLIASAQSNLGAALLGEGRLDEAERELGQAYASLLADRGPDHEKTRLTASRLEQLRKARKPAGPE
ncbi:MAG: tetratricopeptide repeat protein [Thermoanaerobaculia bacterium]